MHVLSQSAREFVIKIIEVSLWSFDSLIGRFLLLILTTHDTGTLMSATSIQFYFVSLPSICGDFD